MIELKESLTEEMTLSQIVTNNFRAAGVFEKYNLDFCCRGNKSLIQACGEKDIDPELVINDLGNALDEKKDSVANHNEWQLDFLIDYIVNIHHSYVRNMIPVLTAHTQKVASVHGQNHPETFDIARLFGIVYKDLKQHMMKEEEILFPYIKQLVKVSRGESSAERPYFGTINNPIKMMELEHQAAGDDLFEIRRLTNNYTPPEDACNTYKVCYQELKDFEEDLHRHIHLENNILFPKAVLMEKSFQV